MNDVRTRLAPVLLVVMLTLAACGLTDATGPDPDAIVRVENATAHTLYVAPISTPAGKRLVGSGEDGRLAPGATLTMPLAGVLQNDRLALMLHLPTGRRASGRSELIRAVRIERPFEASTGEAAVVVGPRDLWYDQLFGDEYRIHTAADGVHPHDITDPALDGDRLSVWVGYGGCSDGTFTLSIVSSDDDEAWLAVVHDYPLPPGSVDCERYGMQRLELPVPAEARTHDHLRLLNPVRGGDPFAGAFVLRTPAP